MIREIKQINGFFTADVKGALTELDMPDTKIVMLQWDTQGIELDRISQWNQYLKRTDNNTVILTTAYISTEEFPESEWYLPDEENDDTGTKKPIPADAVLKRQMRILEAVGFVNVNGFVRYNYKEAYIWPNEVGIKVIGLFKEKE